MSPWSMRKLAGLSALAWWAGLLALLPWWLGLALLLALTALAIAAAHRAAHYGDICRRGIEWGLLGLLFAVQRTLGGDLLAWIVALLGGLAGFSLLAGLQSWLDRAAHHAPILPAVTAEWPELALAPIGPVATLIELTPPAWQAESEVNDPYGGAVTRHDGGYHFADGRRIAGDGACCFSPDGGWFVAAAADGSIRSLWDRARDRVHHPRGWILCGWHAGQPWLNRNAHSMPRPWQELAARRG